MGMQFSPMYQPVTTKTIKADGDLNVNPYDLLATDVKCDTVEADEFVGGVGNFSSLVLENGIDGNLIKMPTLSYDGYYTITYGTLSNNTGTQNFIGPLLYSSPFPISGKISVKTTDGSARIGILSLDGYTVITPTTTQTEYTVTNCLWVQAWCVTNYQGSPKNITLTVGIPKLVSS